MESMCKRHSILKSYQHKLFFFRVKFPPQEYVIMVTNFQHKQTLYNVLNLNHQIFKIVSTIRIQINRLK
jgi:hypothetical protein